ncbi:transglutaminase domain-containing protein [Joostella atrarenae]|uniref:Transglutaminase domain-containing protein n=1 Tax=Joostella atrarenae TaxID=679257 RepID=A0ABS9J7L4_9FLAO|nr:transglutaminase-like domain-containing protein [Joostella atrarenae]MCF8716338.1 transglutaminase domain-containing protein [Joostella atrarenae]
MKLKIVLIKFICFSVVSLISCKSREKQDLEWALDLAGENRSELEMVLEHYSRSEKDSLKYRAACFLITKVLPYENSVVSQDNNLIELSTKIKGVIKDYETNNKDSLARRNQLVTSAISDYENKYGKINNMHIIFQRDIESISALFLIKNIDLAFKAWNLPWSRTYDFSTFCEYILPYKSGKQMLVPWREFFFNELTDFRKKLKEETDPVEVCNKLNFFLKSRSFMWSEVFDHSPLLLTGPFMYECSLHGNCESMSNLIVEAMRSIGIPVTEVLYNKYGHVGKSHQTNAILAPDGSWKLLDALTETPVGESAPGSSATKIYRKRAIEKEELNDPAIQTLKLYGWEDITSEVTKAYDIPLRLITIEPNLNEVAYLCIFNPDYKNGWEPIDWTVMEDNSLTFKDISGTGVVYIGMIKNHLDEFIPISNPFILHDDGTQEYIKFQNKKHSVQLFRKYHPKEDFLGKTIGGIFQASNDKGFENAVDLWEIDDTLRLINHKVIINNPSKYQYVRYLFPDGSPGNVSEIEFLDADDKELNGIIMTDQKNLKTPSMKNAFDKDVLSFVYSGYNIDGQWVGLNFGTKKVINSIVFCPRTDKNDVWPGCIYELFYWDKQWVSLGVKDVNNYTIDYNEVPEGALFWLKNYTEGREERIFTIENDEQVWW